MERQGVKRVPVVSDGKVGGIVSRANLVQALANFPDDTPESRADDDLIRARILNELNKQSWAPTSTIDVKVQNGIAELRGTIFDEREGKAVRIAAENVTGIAGVRDHLVWLEPITGMFFEPPDDTPGNEF